MFDADVNAHVSIFIISNLAKFFPKEPEWFRAVNAAISSIKRKFFEQVNGSYNRDDAN